jgi:glycosyltransferase involved in cell wall biosynthesis
MRQNSGDFGHSCRLALALEYPITLPGGVSVLVRALLENLPSRFEIVLLSPDSEDNLPDSIRARLKQHVHCPPQQTLESARGLTDTLRRLGVDMVHFHSGGNYGWGNRRFGTCPIPYLNRAGVLCFHTPHLVVSPFDGYCGPQRPLWQKFALFPLAYSAKLAQLRHTHLEIAVSQHDAMKLRRWYPHRAGKVEQIYHSVLASSARPAPPGLRKKIILSVGHVAFRKGQHILVRAFARIATRHPEWELWIAGHQAESSCWQEIENLIRKHGLEARIKLLGAHSDTATLMRQAGIFVQPSLHEALGLALQEALWYGCPAIGSRVGGIPELIHHQKNGLLVAPGDEQELASAFEKLLTRPELRAGMSIAAHQSISDKKMTQEAMVRRHVEIYDQNACQQTNTNGRTLPNLIG